MSVLTGSTHGDQANDLFLFYQDASKASANAGQYFMAAVALGLATEAALLAYMLVEFMDPSGADLEVPDRVGLNDLVKSALAFDALSAPTDIPNLIGGHSYPAHVAENIVDQIRQFRNLIHPSKALREGFDPRKFTEADYLSYRDMYESICHSLLYNL